MDRFYSIGSGLRKMNSNSLIYLWSSVSSFIRITLILSLFGLTAGCGTPRCHQPTHIVIVDKEGVLRHPQTGKRIHSTEMKEEKRKQPTAAEYNITSSNQGDKNSKTDGYFKDIWEDIGRRHSTNIVIFIQGGLNSESSAIERANTTTSEILADGRYPIFIAWNADLFSSYWEHLMLVHRGKTDPLTAISLSPLTAIADLGRLIFRSPISLLEQSWAGVRTWKTANYESTCNPSEAYAGKAKPSIFPEPEVNLQYCWLKEHSNIDIELGKNDPSASFKSRGVMQSLKSFPNVVSEAIVDTGGKLGWDQMLRRTKTMFTTANTFEKGGIEIFSEELCSFLHTNSNIRVTLVGHSMGTIVATELIRRHGTDLNLSDIVYMGAACGTEEFFRGVVPFLNTQTNVFFHDLCLHPRNDASETYYYFGRGNGVGAIAGLIAPDGSLLDWIDYYYSSTETDFGRMLGKWENAVLGVKGIVNQGYLNHLSPHQISIKGFGVGPARTFGPQHHGDFGNIRYWDPRAWQPGVWDESLWDPVRTSYNRN